MIIKLRPTRSQVANAGAILRSLWLVAVAGLAYACGGSQYTISLPALGAPNADDPGVPGSSGTNASSLTNGCSLSVDNPNPTVGQTIHFSLQSVPFGPTINACLTGTINGAVDWTCAYSQPTGPIPYSLAYTVSVVDVGAETRYAQVTDASGNPLCTSNTVTVNTSTSASVAGNGGTIPTAVGGTATQPCWGEMALDPNLNVGGSAVLGVKTTLSGSHLATCWYGTKSGVAIQDCWVPPEANGAPNPAPAAAVSASGTTAAITPFTWNFLAGDWGAYSMYAKIIETSNETVTNVVTGTTQVAIPGQVLCQTNGAPLNFTVQKASCTLASNKSLYGVGDVATWTLNTKSPNLSVFEVQNRDGAVDTNASGKSMGYPGLPWAGTIPTIVDPAFTAASRGVIDRSAVLRDGAGQDACVTNTVEIVVEPGLEECAAAVNQTTFSVSSQTPPIYTITAAQSGLNVFWYGTDNGIPDMQGTFAGAVGTNGQLTLVGTPFNSTQEGSYSRYFLLMDPALNPPAPVCVTSPIPIQVNP